MSQELIDENAMIEYLQLKIRRKDWHAVSDAANDLREMQIENKNKPIIIFDKGIVVKSRQENGHLMIEVIREGKKK